MNSETEDEDYPLTKFVLGRVAFDYIPCPILREIDKSKLDFQDSHVIIGDNGVKCLQILLDNSNNQLRMYGTAKELADNLKIFRNFPFSHKVFGFDNSRPNFKPYHFQSLKGEVFVRKDKHLREFHSVVYRQYALIEKAVPSELMEHMKYQEKQFDKCYEFIRYDKCTFNQILKELDKVNENISSFQSEEHDNLLNQSENKSALKVYQNTINTYPEIFLPYAETNNENVPIVVRIFEDGAERFVMKSELSRLNKNEDVDENTLKHETKNGILYTMELNEVFKTFRNQMNKIEFIRIPITRAKHAAVPIVTPTGDHCILAADALLEILRRLISALNIFQKIKSDSYNDLSEYMSLLEKSFFSDVNCKYFIILTKFDKMIEEMDSFWKKYENVHAESVRDVGKDGFTVNNLKDELKYLGLTDAFPEITNYAEGVHAEIDQYKNEEFLRTCDLFDALEKCQLICILNRFPNLKEFLHNQKACHRASNLQCEVCPKQIAPAKFRNTKWKEYKDNEVELGLQKGETESESYWFMSCSDDEIIRSNYMFFSREAISEYNIKQFFVDDEDARWISSRGFNSGMSGTWRTWILSLENFSVGRNYMNRIFIRSICTPCVENRVFTVEVLEIIPIVLKKQKTPIKSSDDRLKKYRKKWECKEKDIYNTIDIKELRNVLEEFDIDKSLITIAPIGVHPLETYEMSESASDVKYRSIYSPNGKMVMDNEQAAFFIFKSLVLDFNWNFDDCTEHQHCTNDLKKNVIDAMKHCSKIDKGIFVTIDYVEEIINKLKEHCSFKHILKYPTTDLRVLDDYSKYPLSLYHSEAKSHKLPIYTVPSSKETRNKQNEIEIPVWMVRMFYLFGQIDNFCGKDDDLHAIIQFIALFEIPQDIMKKEQDTIKPFLNLKIRGDEMNNSRESNRKVKTNAMENDSTCVRNSGENENSKDNSMREVSNLKETEKEKKEVGCSSEMKNNSVEEPETISNEEKCSLCLKTVEMYNDIQKELIGKSTQLKAYEQNIEIAGKTIIAMEAQIQKLNERNSSLQISCGENKQINQKMANIVAAEAKLKESNKKLTEKNRALEQEIIKMKEKAETDKKNTKKSFQEEKDRIVNEFTEKLQQLNEENISLREMSGTDRLNNSVKQNSLENQLSESDRVVNDLRQTNTRISIENEQYEKTNHMLLDRLSSAPPTSSSNQTSSTKTEVEIPGGYRFQLVTLQKIKDTIRSGNALKHAKEMVEKLISLTNRSEIHQFANYELSQFEGNIRNYLQAVETNIQKLKETRNVTDLPSLPDHPSLSDRFMKEYWSEVDKQPSTSSEMTSELADSECLICLVNMESSDETIKCDNCRRRFHSKCASEWLKRKSVCPACSRGLLDPSEFPSLG